MQIEHSAKMTYCGRYSWCNFLCCLEFYQLGNSCLARSAHFCRAVFQHALDALWREPRDLISLLNLLKSAIVCPDPPHSGT
ncbi:hypothetical protein BKA93DRAFT_791960 [Sparassis latifolia]